MAGNSLARGRKWVSIGSVIFLVLACTWYFSPGLPAWWGPSADPKTKAEGRHLFVHEWTVNDPLAKGDGLGPVFNAKSCVACHFQGGVGGGGGNEHNVVAFEVLPRSASLDMTSGLVHHFASDSQFKETPEKLRSLFPIVKGAVVVRNNCSMRAEDFDPVHTESINSTALFGAGWLDRVPEKAILYHARARNWENFCREVQFDFEAIPAGRPRILTNGRVGKFGWKAQFASLDDFVAAACANELGLGTPKKPQATPLGYSVASTPADLDKKQFKAMVSFVDTLPKPIEAVPSNEQERESAEKGKKLFTQVGCALCHVPDMGGVKGVYSDFLLHEISDPDADGTFYGRRIVIPPPPEHPRMNEWKTSPLWGVADSAPYFHDGGSPTLHEAIVRHAGHAKPVTTRYKTLPSHDQEAIVAFLKTLKAPPPAR